MPKKRTSEPKSATIILRVTAEDKRALEEKARERALTLTEYLTRTGLGRSARQRSDVDAINLLRECADELKAIHIALRGMPTDDAVSAGALMDETMQAICTAIGRVWQNESTA